MAGAPLFHPDNRMLGGFAHDFALYGGQLDPAVTTRPATQADLHDDVGGSTTTPAAVAEQAVVPEAPDTGLDRTIADQDPARLTTSAGPAAATTHADIGETDFTTPATPTAGSATSPEILASLAPHSATPLPESENAPAVSAANTEASLVADQVGEGIIPLLGSLSVTSAALAGLAAHDLSQTIDGTLHGVSAVGTGVAGGIVHAAAPIASGVTSTIEATAQTLDGAVGHGLSLADDLAGSDPAGGITTLVGMVNTVDQFAVSSTGPAHAVDAPGSIVDDLIGGSDGVGLLGGVDHQIDGGHVAHDPTDHVLAPL